MSFGLRIQQQRSGQANQNGERGAAEENGAPIAKAGEKVLEDRHQDGTYPHARSGKASGKAPFNQEPALHRGNGRNIG